jgi:glutathione peroxidase-family protein
MSDAMKRTFIILTGLLVVVAALFMNAAKNANGYAIGDFARDFELKNVDGKTVSLKNYPNAKGFIVVFTCNTCPYAKHYEQRIINLDKNYKDKGFPVIAINPNDVSQQPGDSMDEMVKLASEKGYTFPYLRDDSQEITAAYGATKTPHIYLLSNQAGKYRVEYIGAIDDSPRDESGVKERYVEDAIAALLAGKKPKTTEVRAIGCTIKWKNS